MRIDDTLSPSLDPRSVQLDRSAEVRSDQRGRGRSGGPEADSVDLSSLGASLARALSEQSPTEIARVEQLREAVSTGRLDVSDEQIADALIDATVRDGLLEAELAGVAGAGGRP